MLQKFRYFILLCFLASAWTALAQTPNSTELEKIRYKRILIVNSFNSSYPYYYPITQNFFRRLGSNSELCTSSTQLELDSLHDTDPNSMQDKLDGILPEVKARKFDVIVAIGDAALQILRKNFYQIPLEIPIVFFGQYDYQENLRSIRTNVTGVISKLTPVDNIQLGIKLFPETSKIVLLTDETPNGAYVQKQAEEYVKNYKELQLQVYSSKDMTLDQLLWKLEVLPKDALIVYYGWDISKSNNFSILHRILSGINSRINQNIPVLVMRESLVNFDVFGGITPSDEQIGELVGEMTLDILTGKKAENIFPARVTPRLYLNWNHFKMHKLSTSQLPEIDTHFIGRPESVFQKYLQIVLYISLAAVVTLFFLILFLLLFIWKRRTDRQHIAMFNRLPVRVYVLNLSGDIVDCYMEFGKTFSDEFGPIRNIAKMPGLDYQTVLNILKTVSRDNSVEQMDYTYDNNSRSIIFSKLPDEIYNRETIIAVSQDITELQKSKKVTANLAKQFQQTLRAIGDGVITTDLEENVTLMNTAAMSMTGWREQDAIGKKTMEIFNAVTADTKVPETALMTRALRSKGIIKQVRALELTSLGGRVRQVSCSAAPVFDAEGETIGGVLVFRDISREELQKKQIRSSFQTLQCAARLAEVACFEIDRNWILQDFIAPGRSFPFRKGEKFVPDGWVYPEELQSVKALLNDVLTGVKTASKLNFRAINGGKISYYNLVAAMRDPNDLQNSRVFGVIQDITTITESRMRYKNMDTLLKTIFDSLPCPAFILNTDKRMTYQLVNKEYEKILQMSAEDMIGHTDYEIFQNQDVADKYFHDNLTVIQKQEKIETTDTLQTPNGKKYYIKSIKAVLRQVNGPTLLLGFMVNVTELEMAKRKEEDARKILQALLDNLPLGIMAKDANDDFRYMIWNKTLADWFDKPVESVLGKTDAELGFSPDTVQRLHNEDMETLRNGGISVNTKHLNSVHGKKIMQTIDLPLKLENGKTMVIAAMLDITRERQLQMEREEMIERLNSYIDDEQTINQCLAKIVLSEDYETNIGMIFDAARRKLNCEHLSFGRFEDHDTYRFEHEWSAMRKHPLRVLRSRSLEKCLTLWTSRLEEDKLVIVSDVTKSEESGIFEKLLARTCVITPIMVDGKFWGTFNVAYSELHDFTDKDENLTRSTAYMLSLIFRHERHARELDAANRQTTMILNNVKIPIWLHDNAGTLVRANTAACQLANVMNETDLIAMPAALPVFSGKSGNPVTEVLNNRTTCSFETVLKEREYQVTADPILDTEGALINVVESAIDVTDMNEGRRQQEIAMKAAQASNSAKSYFLAMMSHELRTPLNTVIGFCELIQRKEVSDPEIREYLDEIHEAGDSLLGLINDILELSKIEADQIELTPKKTDLKELTADLSRIYEPKAAAKHLTFKIEAEPFSEIELDELRLRQVLLNLCENAIRFTDHGGVTLHFKFQPDSTKQNVGILRISVTDTGCGIPKENQLNVFKPFSFGEQPDGGRGNWMHDEVGLGLAISYRLVVKMNGKLFLKNTGSGGTCFVIELKDVPYASSVLQPSAAASAPQLPEAASKSYVFLIVDDIPINLKVLESMLMKLNIRCLKSTSAKEALHLLEQNAVDMILTDMWMPEMDGVEFANQVRKNEKTASIPIVAITADADSANNFPMVMFSHTILKPLTLNALRNLIQLFETGKLA